MSDKPPKEKKLKDQPYYPNYSANFIAQRHYRLMSLEERGLLWAMYNDYWVNKDLPSDPQELARYLGFDSAIVENALTDNVLHYFSADGDKLKCPELDGYLQNVGIKRDAQSEGGKLGVERKKGKNALGQPEGIPEGQPEGSLNQFNLTQVKSDQLKSNSFISEGGLDKSKESNKKWIDDYDKAKPPDNDYLKQSKGH